MECPYNTPNLLNYKLSLNSFWTTFYLRYLHKKHIPSVFRIPELTPKVTPKVTHLGNKTLVAHFVN